MSRWRTLIVDDEAPARRRMQKLLEPHDTVEVVEEASSVGQAADLLRANDIDLIFLDIHMPGETGFALWDHVDVHAHVVFVTAFDEYAVRAFERDALDYLMKPVDPDRLEATLKRLGKPATPTALTLDGLVCLQLKPGYRFVRVRDIATIEAQGDYTLVRLSDGSSELVNVPLYRWVERLPAESFARVHRGGVVQLGLIQKLEQRGSAWCAHVEHVQTPIDVSRGYLKALKDRFAL